MPEAALPAIPPDGLKDPFPFADTTHTIRRMNRAAAGPDKEDAALLGRSLLDCPHATSQAQIGAIAEQFGRGAAEERPMTDNKKQRIYMRAVRDPAGRRLGYYERYEPPAPRP